MMRSCRRIVAAMGLGAALAAGACGGRAGPTGPKGPAGGDARLCDGIRTKVAQLYRVEAMAKEPRRVDEAVADNTAMVMNDCARAPAAVSRCVDAVASVAELEKKCLVQLDDEGTEGEELRP